MSQCSLAAHPPSGLADDALIGATRRLVNSVIETPEYQAYIEAAGVLNQDSQAGELSQLIRSQRHGFAQSAINELQSQLDALPVMENFLTAQQALIYWIT